MRRHLPFLLILVGTAIVRFVILFVSQTHLTSDEAIIGLMAKHILEGRYFPFYFYGISYNASCAWEAYLAVVPFAIAGVGVVALKIPTVLLSLACLALFYAMTTRLFSIRVATSASLIFALWPGLLKWHFLFFEKPEAGGLTARFGLQAWREIFLHEMPKFFSADTVLWYYPETHWSGYILYFVTALAVVIAAWGALPKIRNAFSSGFATTDTNKDLLILILIGVSFVPYIIAPLRVPGYFLGATFFMSILIARCVDRFLGGNKMLVRAVGAAMLLAVVVCGVDAGIETATHNQIETLTLCPNRQDHCMLRVPGKNLDAIKQDLEQNRIKAVWTSISFVYPLIFETGEKLIASESIFGVDRPVYPPSIPKPEPSNQDRTVFVIE